MFDFQIESVKIEYTFSLLSNLKNIFYFFFNYWFHFI